MSESLSRSRVYEMQSGRCGHCMVAAESGRREKSERLGVFTYAKQPVGIS